MMSFGPRSYPLDVFPYILYTNFPIRTMEDLEGQRLRAAEDPVTVRFYELLGAQPMAIAFEELSTACATGMIDGLQTSPPETWLIAAGVYDYLSYKLDNALWWNPCPMVIDKGWWESIDEDLRLKMEAVIPYWADSVYLEFLSAREHCYALTEETFGGPEYITTLSDAELARWKEVLSPLYDEVFAIEGTQELYDAIQRYQ
ncbi:C4-dicarboxylate-binding periplasmic protein DctP [subsurface metagenome]